MEFNKRDLGVSARAVPTPGVAKVNTIAQLWPNNATVRPNTVNGTNLNNGLVSMPKDINQGLAKQQENLRLLADTFEAEIAMRSNEDYRRYFTRVTIPLHEQSLSKMFMKSTGIDEDPTTAALTGIEGWDPKINEVAIQGSSIEVITNAYGRMFKKHRFAENIMKIRWYDELASKFADNASRTLNNLAGIRAYNGSNKIFVKSVAAFDESNPHAARLTLGADASTVDAFLTWDTLREAVYLMQNYEETYTVVNQSNGDLSTKKRKAVVTGFYGNAYAVVLGWNGYNQLCNDPEFRKAFIVNGGLYAEQVATQTLGVNTPFLGMKFDIINTPITISKASSPVVATDGTQELEVAFVVGGSNGVTTAVELTLEGWTKMINVDYDEDKKVDLFGLLAIVGWISITDFAIIRNEAWYAIPYKKSSYVLSGDATPSADVVWKA